MNGQTGFPRQEIRSLLLEYLSQHPQGQFSQAVQGVIDLAKKHGTYAGSKSNIQRMGGPSYDLDSHGYRVVPETVRQLFWQLLVQGLLVWGSDDINPNLPFYRVADYGQSILKHEGARPYDPDGFLKEFATTNSQADSVVLDYLEEAVQAFNSDCHKAAAVMLGCASEQLVLVLHEAFPQAACAQSNDCSDHLLPVMPVDRRTVCQTSRGANPRQLLVLHIVIAGFASELSSR